MAMTDWERMVSDLKDHVFDEFLSKVTPTVRDVGGGAEGHKGPWRAREATGPKWAVTGARARGESRPVPTKRPRRTGFTR